MTAGVWLTFSKIPGFHIQWVPIYRHTSTHVAYHNRTLIAAAFAVKRFPSLATNHICNNVKFTLIYIFLDESSFLGGTHSPHLTGTDLAFGVIHSRMPEPVIIKK